VTVTATYVNASAKVTVAISSAPANAVTALIERSPDQVTWTTVRGAAALQLSGGAFSLDDYEFADGQANYYRVTYSDTTAPVYVSSAALATTTSAGATASVTPALPSGVVDGDTVYLVFSCTKVTATLTSVTGGFTGIWAAGQLTLYGVRWSSGMAAPTVTWGGLASGDIVMAKTIRYRNSGLSTSLGTVNVVGQANVAAANIAYAAGTGAGTAMLLAYQASTHTSVSPVATTDDHATGYALMGYHAGAAPVGAGTITVTGGSSAISNTLSAVVRAYGAPLVTQDSTSVTPALTQAWVKNPVRPYLNRTVIPIDVGPGVRKSRTATFDVIARTLPVAVTDVFGGRTTPLTVRTTTRQATDDLENCWLTGETMFLQGPAGSRMPTGYFVFGDITRSPIAAVSPVRYLQIPLTEVAAPSPLLAAALSSYQTVLSTYATYQALATAKASYQAVLQLVGTPADVITS
jgi:hypothetical protein